MCVFLVQQIFVNGATLSCVCCEPLYVSVAGFLFVLAYTGVMFLLGSYAAAKVISAMQSSSVAAVIASKVLSAVVG